VTVVKFHAKNIVIVMVKLKVGDHVV